MAQSTGFVKDTAQRREHERRLDEINELHSKGLLTSRQYADLRQQERELTRLIMKKGADDPYSLSALRRFKISVQEKAGIARLQRDASDIAKEDLQIETPSTVTKPHNDEEPGSEISKEDSQNDAPSEIPAIRGRLQEPRLIFSQIHVPKSSNGEEFGPKISEEKQTIEKANEAINGIKEDAAKDGRELSIEELKDIAKGLKSVIEAADKVRRYLIEMRDYNAIEKLSRIVIMPARIELPQVKISIEIKERNAVLETAKAENRELTPDEERYITRNLERITVHAGTLAELYETLGHDVLLERAKNFIANNMRILHDRYMKFGIDPALDMESETEVA